MLSRYEILDLISFLKVNKQVDDLVFFERQNEIAKLLGYLNYSELNRSLLSFPESNFKEFSIFLMKKFA